jgi:uncharacterized Zn finger protein (UPF0148 family)
MANSKNTENVKIKKTIDTAIVSINEPAKNVLTCSSAVSIPQKKVKMSTLKTKSLKKEQQHINLETKHAEIVDNIKKKYNPMIVEITSHIAKCTDQLQKNELRLNLANVKKQYNRELTDYYKNSTKYLIDYYSIINEEPIKQFAENNTHFIDIVSKNTIVSKRTKISVLESFLLHFDPTFLVTKNHDMYNECKICGSDLNQSSSDGEIRCITCGYTKDSVLEGVKIAYSDMRTRQSAENCSYSRLQHLEYHLHKIQGKPVNLPDGLLEKLRRMMEEDGVKSKNLTIKKIRTFLQTLGEKSYYDDANYIVECLGGPPAPKLPKDIIELSKIIFTQSLIKFKQIQKELFEHTANPDRRNLVIYDFLIFKIFEMFGFEDFLKHICLQKTEKIYQELETFWYRTCKDYDFKHIK